MVDLGSEYNTIGNSPFAIQRLYTQGQDAMKRPHPHSFYEIFYLLKGQLVIFMNGEVSSVDEGEMVFINREELYSLVSSEQAECECLVISFTHEFVTSYDADLAACLPLDRSKLIRYTEAEQTVIERILHDMLEESDRRPAFYMSALRALLSELLIVIYRAEPYRDDLQQEQPSIYRKISDIALYMNRAYGEPLTLEQVAAQFAISPSYLSRIFKRWTGFHFKQYLQVIRIREAQKLLRETKQSVQTISQQVGFEHIAHFNKTFKKLTGTTPLRYRKANRS